MMQSLPLCCCWKNGPDPLGMAHSTVWMQKEQQWGTSQLLHTPEVSRSPQLSSHHSGAVTMQGVGKGLLAPPNDTVPMVICHQSFLYEMCCVFSYWHLRGDTPASNAPSNIPLSKSVTQSLTCIFFFLKKPSCWIRSTNPRGDTTPQLLFT